MERLVKRRRWQTKWTVLAVLGVLVAAPLVAEWVMRERSVNIWELNPADIGSDGRGTLAGFPVTGDVKPRSDGDPFWMIRIDGRNFGIAVGVYDHQSALWSAWRFSNDPRRKFIDDGVRVSELYDLPDKPGASSGTAFCPQMGPPRIDPNGRGCPTWMSQIRYGQYAIGVTTNLKEGDVLTREEFFALVGAVQDNLYPQIHGHR